jgi:signal transduction histidine kinase
MTSLKRRAMAGAVLWTVAVFVIGVTVFLALFDRLAIAREDELLVDRMIQATVALSILPTSEESMALVLVDPVYDRPYSGRYWQFENKETGEILVSRSLFDTTLVPPPDVDASRTFWKGPGPRGEQVRALSETVMLEDGSTWRVTVAKTATLLEEERRLAVNSAALVFLFLGLLAVGAAAILTRAILDPIERLTSEIENRWTSGTRLEPGAYPDEIVPLVNDVNTLVERNQDIVARARRQAADLAHALKTPSAALRNELDAAAGAGVPLDGAREALDRIDAQLKRTLTRMRAEYAASDVKSETAVAASLQRLERLFRAGAGRDGITLRWSADDGLTLPLHPQDFEEAVGNLIDNAYKWARARIRVSARAEGERVVVDVEDDGPGVAPGEVEAILQPAYRIDTSKAGSGLGLAITQDLVRAYGGTLEIGRSEELGGLKVRMRLPRLSPVRERLRAGTAA